MSTWLLKTEPSTYSFADLVGDKKATWDGVANPTALQNLRAMKKGDTLIIYHTGSEKAAVGLAKVIRAAYPDPKQSDPKLVVIDLAPDRPLAHPVTLAQIKGDKRFAGWDLLRIGRLSVVPTSDAQLAAILQLAAQPH